MRDPWPEVDALRANALAVTRRSGADADAQARAAPERHGPAGERHPLHVVARNLDATDVGRHIDRVLTGVQASDLSHRGSVERGRTPMPVATLVRTRDQRGESRQSIRIVKPAERSLPRSGDASSGVCKPEQGRLADAVGPGDQGHRWA